MNNVTQNPKMASFINSAKKVIERTEKVSPKKPGTITESSDRYDPALQFEQQLNNSYEQTYAPINTGGFSQAASKLPREMLESFQKNPISEFNSMNGLSVLDSLGIQKQQPPQPKQQINEDYYPEERAMPTTEQLLARSRALHEQKQPTQQPGYGTQIPYQPQPNIVTSNNIDYSMIRIIIEDCISKQLNELKRTMLNESTISGQKGDVILTIGDSIKFIAKNGNVYEGVVRKVGNIKP